MQRAAYTKTEYQGFQQAYDFFNRELFDRSLPQVLVTLQRHANTRGYFSPQRFHGRIDKTAVHELALNPDSFPGRSDASILSTLVHEMAHVWQQTYGDAPRRGYHDRQWAAKMREIGLQPSSTGEEGGKETGQRMSHYILPGGNFANAYATLAARDFHLHWQSVPVSAHARGKKASKTKYSCPKCGQNAWAKPDALLICGVCSNEGQGKMRFMLAKQVS
jgi:predicted SprT family Zn-dependent metalloprotease